MKLEMEKANVLAENLQRFLNLVSRTYENNSFIVVNPEKLYRLKLLVEEYRFQILTDELFRLNKIVWDERQTIPLVKEIKEKILIIDQYIENNHDDLFLFSARMYGIKAFIDSLVGPACTA